MYRDRHSPHQSPIDAWLNTGFPLTIVIISLNFLTMALYAFRVPVGEYLALIIPQSLFRPWTLLTYPFASFDIIQMIFYGIGLYFFGASLERSWGTRLYGTLFLSLAFITAIGLTAGAFLLRESVVAFNWLPLGALVLAWCALNSNEEIRFNFIFPIKGKWLALLEIVIIFFVYARFHPLMGCFALSGCAAALAWVQYRPWRDIGYHSVRSRTRSRVVRPGSKPRDDRFSLRDLNPFERIARWRRRKQFERLMKDD